MDEKKVHELLEHYQEEIQEYKAEQDQVKSMMGAIGGSHTDRKEKIISVLLILVLILTFSLGYIIPGFSKFLAIELGILLVSIKVMIVMHQQQKMQHFQFWILNSIEWKITRLEKQHTELKKIMTQGERERD
ncbi:hypothetical protein PVA45_06890 [Entomospira entomophila]|uniref:Uncharacterized protein n=1 Tax=Entomospira entomophila TaxID=2719988 RepID=A0A968GB16_9SPIO|nr:hypothetical protein [Entomospira entomophilus]NIZ41227.1 hypothetical protein [Entomospira entomophilus]WDI35432.1 hypothetical protein PVA45_06890 [Entomospira entomophilus]